MKQWILIAFGAVVVLLLASISYQQWSATWPADDQACFSLFRTSGRIRECHEKLASDRKIAATLARSDAIDKDIARRRRAMMLEDVNDINARYRRMTGSMGDAISPDTVP